MTVVGNERQLFVDGKIIESMANLKQQTLTPDKHGENPLLFPDQPWEGNMVTFCCVIYDSKEHMYKMWYLAGDIWGSRSNDDKRTISDSTFICYAISNDGLKWEKPKLGLVEYLGSKNNNIVLRHQGSHFDSLHVIYCPNEVENKYRMVVFQGTWPYDPLQIKSMGFRYDYPPGHFGFVSSDGISWKKITECPLVPLKDAMDRSNWWLDKKRNKFVASLKWNKGGKRVRRYSESEDFINWAEPSLMLEPDHMDNSDVEFYGALGFDYESMYLGFLEVFYTSKNTICFELIYSRDGKHWKRTKEREMFLSTGSKKSWDSEFIFAAGTPPLRKEKEVIIYYNGSNIPHGSRGGRVGSCKNDSTFRAIGASNLRRDGFVCVQADESRGLLTTVPLEFENSSLFINADATDGKIVVEIIRLDYDPLPDYSSHVCVPITEDTTRKKVIWNNAKELPKYGSYCIRFKIFNAKLYSFWTE